jgi:small subunit ribosomal protein S17
MDNVKKSKKTRVGSVISNKMDKSIVVLVERLVKHKFYGKYIRRRVKFMADDPENSCNIGDVVMIEECRPLSKSKRWRVRTIVERAV